jgi:hypothetical protein
MPHGEESNSLALRLQVAPLRDMHHPTIRRGALTMNAVVHDQFAGGVRTEALPLPVDLIDLTSAEGMQLFLESDALRSYLPLANNFLTQEKLSYCGIASIVMVLNALHVPAPASVQFAPFRTFTQDNLLNEGTDAVIPRTVIAQRGVTLEQVAEILRLFSVHAEAHHAANSSVEQFREVASAYLAKPDHAVLVNYLRKTIGQEHGGHISPLAAYDRKADRFLILDVARYKYPPVWVEAAELFDAMNTPDVGNEYKTRGFVLVSRRDYRLH